MNTTRPCGCKGHRSCKVCELEFGISPLPALPAVGDISAVQPLYYSINGENSQLEALGFTGIQLIEDFISCEEEEQLIRDLDALPWDRSQSGRRKQNYGPRTNFKKRKAKLGGFRGFPASTKFVQDRFNSVGLLEGYRSVEQCSIEYTPETGASIEPHIDDCWVWGERIVQLNLLSSTYLTLIPYSGPRYNLQDVCTYPRTVDAGLVVHNPLEGRFYAEPYPLQNLEAGPRDVIVKVPLPPRSLLVMYGASRYEWEHAVLREDIKERRVIIAYRELTPTYLPRGEQQDVGREILAEAAKFWDDKLESEAEKKNQDDKNNSGQLEITPSSVA